MRGFVVFCSPLYEGPKSDSAIYHACGVADKILRPKKMHPEDNPVHYKALVDGAFPNSDDCPELLKPSTRPQIYAISAGDAARVLPRRVGHEFRHRAQLRRKSGV
jgi:hypothetical protein